MSCIWALPTCLITLCFFTSCSCGYSQTRPSMQKWGLCSSIRNFESTSPCYLDLLNAQVGNIRPGAPSQYMRSILVSRNLLEDTEVALSHYTEEMQLLSPRLIQDEGLTISLNKSHIVEYSVRSLRWSRSSYRGYLKPQESNRSLCFRVMYGERFHGRDAA